MTPVAHALLPAIAAHARLSSAGHPLHGRHLALIATAGILPDLLTPHTHLEDRLASGPHTLAATAILYFCLRLVSALRPRALPVHIVGWMTFAYALHIACDSITCGTAPFRPFSDIVIGADTPWAPTWFIADALSLFLAVRGGLFSHLLAAFKRRRPAPARSLPTALGGPAGLPVNAE